MIHAGGGRVTGLHYGTYDYSASLGVAAEYQSLEHPVADHAKAVMQVAAAGTGVFVSDGSTNVLPVGDRDAVRAAWRLHVRLVRRSLERGIYQGWDMHPGPPARAAMSRRTPSSGRGCPARPSGSARTCTAGSPASSTSRRRPRRWPDSCSAASSAAPLDAAELDKLVGVDPDTLAALAKRRPKA